MSIKKNFCTLLLTTLFATTPLTAVLTPADDNNNGPRRVLIVSKQEKPKKIVSLFTLLSKASKVERDFDFDYIKTFCWHCLWCDVNSKQFSLNVKKLIKKRQEKINIIAPQIKPLVQDICTSNLLQKGYSLPILQKINNELCQIEQRDFPKKPSTKTSLINSYRSNNEQAFALDKSDITLFKKSIQTILGTKKNS